MSVVIPSHELVLIANMIQGLFENFQGVLIYKLSPKLMSILDYFVSSKLMRADRNSFVLNCATHKLVTFD